MLTPTGILDVTNLASWLGGIEFASACLEIWRAAYISRPTGFLRGLSRSFCSFSWRSRAVLPGGNLDCAWRITSQLRSIWHAVTVVHGVSVMIVRHEVCTRSSAGCGGRDECKSQEGAQP